MPTILESQTPRPVSLINEPFPFSRLTTLQCKILKTREFCVISAVRRMRTSLIYLSTVLGKGRCCSPKMKVKVTQSCLTLCNPMDCSPPGSSIHGILQTIKLEWVTMPSSRGSSDPWIEAVSYVSCFGRQVLYH